MGYTHYWAFDPTHPEADESIGPTILDAKRIIDAVDVPLAAEFDTPDEPPELAEGWLRFNGVGDDGHETFLLARHPERLDASSQAEVQERGFVWSFCQTARKPYDLVVCAVLLRAVTHMPTAFTIGSDGEWDDEWQHGAQAWRSLPGGPPPERGTGARQLVSRLFGPAADPRVSPLTATTHGPPSARRPTGQRPTHPH